MAGRQPSPADTGTASVFRPGRATSACRVLRRTSSGRPGEGLGRCGLGRGWWCGGACGPRRAVRCLRTGVDGTEGSFGSRARCAARGGLSGHEGGAVGRKGARGEAGHSDRAGREGRNGPACHRSEECRLPCRRVRTSGRCCPRAEPSHAAVHRARLRDERHQDPARRELSPLGPSVPTLPCSRDIARRRAGTSSLFRPCSRSASRSPLRRRRRTNGAPSRRRVPGSSCLCLTLRPCRG